VYAVRYKNVSNKITVNGSVIFLARRKSLHYSVKNRTYSWWRLSNVHIIRYWPQHNNHILDSTVFLSGPNAQNVTEMKTKNGINEKHETKSLRAAGTESVICTSLWRWRWCWWQMITDYW